MVSARSRSRNMGTTALFIKVMYMIHRAVKPLKSVTAHI